MISRSGIAITIALLLTPSLLLAQPVDLDVDAMDELSAHERHVCGRNAEGRWHCWSGTRDAASPRDAAPDIERAPTLEGASQADFGTAHACLLSEGQVSCWGDNSVGQLATAKPGKVRSKPHPVELPEPVTALSVAGDGACALAAGELWCWGLHWYQHQGRKAGTEPVRVPLDGTARALAMSPSHACAIRDEDGSVLCWGRSRAGELGDATTIDRQAPVRVRGLSNVRDVAVGMDHSCALGEAGTVQCWGSNAHGQLGAPESPDSMLPVEVPGVTGARAIAAAPYLTCALLESGQVSCWGAAIDPSRDIHLEFLRQTLVTALRFPSRHIEENFIATEPWEVIGVDDATHIDLGAEHACASRQSGTPVCWGHNDERQLSDGTTISRNAPVAPLDLEDITTVASSPHHSCAVARSGAVWCWGHNAEGQLGLGTRRRGKAPQRVKDIESAMAISASARHTCALLKDLSVRCWGANDAGQLGDGTTEERLEPVHVSDLEDAPVREIITAKRHTCALLESGNVRCWGDNSEGQLEGLNALQSIARLTPGHLDDTCAVDDQGRAWCWGAGWKGMQTLELPPVVGLALSQRHACALFLSGTVQCWGANDAGQLGDGTMLDRDEPAPVVGIEDAVQIDVGVDFSCARLASGAVWCWGSNQRGQIGAGR